MNLPKIPNLTNEQVEAIILKVANNHRHKCFGVYTEQDIIQEAALIALQHLPDFDISKINTSKDVGKALESWLNCILSTRLANLYRDKHVVPQRENFKRPKKNNGFSRKRLYNPKPFDYNIDIQDKTFDFAFTDEIVEILHLNLTLEDLIVLESEINGEIVPSWYKNKLRDKLESIWQNSNE